MGDVFHTWAEAEKKKIRTCVDNILSSSLFSGSPRQQRFLNFLVTKTLDGEANHLKGYTIAVEVFDRPGDFDPSVDSIVRVEATRLRNKLREYYAESGHADEVHIDFPKGGYHLEMSFRDAVSDGHAIVNKPALIEDRPSLVVLPFANIGSDKSREYFADGVTDALISMLSRLSGLFIISRQSSFAYRGTMKSSLEIAAELGVRFLLEGSVQHAGNQIRVAAQLIDAIDGGHIWSDRYDRELKDIFSLQDDLTQRIVHTLQIKLAGAELDMFGQQDTESIEAYDAVQRGIPVFRKYTKNNTQDAITLFSKAIQLDPDYAAAHAWLARAMAFQWAMIWNREPVILDSALEHAQRAIKIAPTSPYPMTIFGWVQLWRKNKDESIAACRNAVTLDPNNAEALMFLSLTLSSAGLGEEGLHYIESAKRLTPISAPLYEYAHGQCYLVLKDYKKAIAAYERGISMSYSFMPNHYSQMFTYAKLGMEKEMLNKRVILRELFGTKIIPFLGIWTDNALEEREFELLEKINSVPDA